MATTLKEFLQQEKTDAALTDLLVEVANICTTISKTIAPGAILGIHGTTDDKNINVQGETQKKLDVISNDAFVKSAALAKLVAGLASEEEDKAVAFPASKGKFLLTFDPLDGSSNIEANISIGTIFSVLPAPASGGTVTDKDFLQPGTKQLAAGYALYGPSTILILTTGHGVNGFTLDPASGQFVLTHTKLNIVADTSEYAINSSNQRFWEPPVQRYVAEANAGKEGPRGRNFNMRWVASMVAEIHRILTRGGVFMYPRDYKDPSKPGRLRLMYEANPMSFVIEQAGGAASTGRGRILEVTPTELHQRVPVIVGSKNEVAVIDRYHVEQAEGTAPVSSPLLKERSLLRS